MTELFEENSYWWRDLDDSEPDTRGKLLQAAYREIHCQGFQSASLSNILARTGVTKGALYYHFPNKTALGYAVIDEVISERIHLGFVKPLQKFENPIEGLIELIETTGEAFSLRDIQLGCPLTALAQEMASIDEGFRSRLCRIYDQWHGSIANILQRARNGGFIRMDVDPEIAAVTIVAIMEGALNAAKVSQDMGRLYQCGAGLIQYLQLFKVPDKGA
jgi:AcrR family transcriptional regulator